MSVSDLLAGLFELVLIPYIAFSNYYRLSVPPWVMWTIVLIRPVSALLLIAAIRHLMKLTTPRRPILDSEGTFPTNRIDPHVA